MERMKFKASLFGFHRRQVLKYIDTTCQGYEQRLQEQETAHKQYEAQVEKQLQEVTASLENSRIVCGSLEQENHSLQQQVQSKEECLREAAGLIDEFTNRFQFATQEKERLQQQLEQAQQQVSQKNALIAAQGLEVSRLQEQVAALEERFITLQGQTEQSTVLVDCLNVLHDRNRTLISQIASLETRLEDATHGEYVEEQTKSLAQHKQMISSTEQLFAALRKEIGEALDSISSKIESGNISETDDGNYYVDMANL